MQTTKREHGVVMTGRLLAAPYQYQFVQLLNILLRMLRQQDIPYADAFRTVLRFRNSLSLAFPASEIESLQVDDAPASRRIYITPAFIGLLGTSGTLPLHDTERAAAKTHVDADESWKPFLDLFSNRVIGLFYEAWGKYRVEHGLNTQGRDHLLPRLAALGGHGVFRTASAVPAEVTGYYAALLRTRPITASTVERVLSDYFRVPIRLEEFVGAWDALAPKMQSTLGVTDPTLGYGAVLGTRLWRNDLRIRLHIGPLDEPTARSFLPRGASHAALASMMGLFAVPSVQIEMQLLLAESGIQPLTLRTRGQDRKRLGWNAFLTGKPGKASWPDIRAVLRLPQADCAQSRPPSSR